MKDNLINVIFIIDESGSMYASKSDVMGGFQKVIEEQKAIKEGECIVSLYTFDGTVREHYIGKKLEEVKDLDYNPGGVTALNDAVGTAVTQVGKWLSNMKEEDRPSQNLVVIMTDGEENASHEYTIDKVREMIKHQEEKYNWSFIYMGSDLTNTKDATSLGISNQAYSTRADFSNNYSIVGNSVSAYRMSESRSLAKECMDTCLYMSAEETTSKYKANTGLDMN